MKTPPRNDSGPPTESKKSTGDKYFRKKTAVHLRSIPAVLDALDRAWMDVRRSTDLVLPEQNMQSKEVFVATLFVWVSEMVLEKGIREYERLMRGPFERMQCMVWEDLKTRPHEGDKPGPRAQITHQANHHEEEPEAIPTPKSAGRKPPGKRSAGS